VILDVFSRYVVGWMIAPRESDALAEKLIAETCERQGIQPGQLTVHADRGSSMRSKVVAQLLADLGVTKTHSRPHVSNDNPFSEAGFKTLKYRPDFPERFGSIQDARTHCVDFFAWYNAEHYHSGIGLQTPEDVHYGHAPRVLVERAGVLEAAHAAHPERFVRGVPVPPPLPTQVWINKPASTTPSPTEFSSASGADRSAWHADEPNAFHPEVTPAATREDRTARPPTHAGHQPAPARNSAEAHAAPLN